MRDWVSEWVQEGRLWVWRYAEPNRSWRGWHFTGDPPGCRSIRNLLDRMHGGEARHRTLRIEPVVPAILRVPNYGPSVRGRFDKLRIEYQPASDELELSPDGDKLVLTVGRTRLRDLSSAFASVEAGDGDFGISTSDKKQSEHWMFWWLPGELRN